MEPWKVLVRYKISWAVSSRGSSWKDLHFCDLITGSNVINPYQKDGRMLDKILQRMGIYQKVIKYVGKAPVDETWCIETYH